MICYVVLCFGIFCMFCSVLFWFCWFGAWVFGLIFFRKFTKANLWNKHTRKTIKNRWKLFFSFFVVGLKCCRLGIIIKTKLLINNNEANCKTLILKMSTQPNLWKIEKRSQCEAYTKSILSIPCVCFDEHITRTTKKNCWDLKADKQIKRI